LSAAIRVKDNYYAAQYKRLKPRRGHKKALGVVKHSMLCAIWQMLSIGETYRDLVGDFSPNATPNAKPDASSPSSNDSDGHLVTLQQATTAENVNGRGGSGSLSIIFLSARSGSGLEA
jgi:hypothetical protein